MVNLTLYTFPEQVRYYHRKEVAEGTITFMKEVAAEIVRSIL